MLDPTTSSESPQFGTAEYKSAPASDVCKVCGQALPGVYYRANQAMVCAGCADRVRRELPQDSHAAFVRALIFGAGGFAAGLALYAGFTILTGIEIGFVSLAVGWLVGKAMMLGSRGIGGRRYQIAAILLTYAAVSMAYIPIGIHFVLTHRPEQTQKTTTQQPEIKTDSASGDVESAPSPAPEKSHDQPPNQGSSPAPGTAPSANPRPAQPSLGAFLGRMVLYGLASPFLILQDEGLAGAIGLVILFVGMQFAWRITAGRSKILLDGPFDNSKSVKV